MKSRSIVLCSLGLGLCACSSSDKTPIHNPSAEGGKDSASDVVDESTERDATSVDAPVFDTLGEQTPGAYCGPVVEVTDAAGLIAVLNTIPYSALGSYTSARLPISSEIRIRGTFSLKSSDLPLPEGCSEYSGCRQSVWLMMESPIQGVQPLEDAPEGVVLFESLTLSNTVVRLRPILRDTHPGPYNHSPAVMLLADCSVPCGEGTSRCATDGVCYGVGEQSCRLCDALPNKTCACASIEEGGLCSYHISGDSICGGTCSQGVCVTDQPFC